MLRKKGKFPLTVETTKPMDWVKKLNKTFLKLLRSSVRVCFLDNVTKMVSRCRLPILL